jgi:hypothetical protein
MRFKVHYYEIAYKVIFLGLILFIVVLTVYLRFFLSESHFQERNVEVCLKEKRLDLQGRIINVIHRKGRSPFFVLKGRNDEVINFYPSSLEFPEIHIKSGDSIYKPVDILYFYIFKNCNPDSVKLIIGNDGPCKGNFSYLKIHQIPAPQDRSLEEQQLLDSLEWEIKKRYPPYTRPLY